MKIHKGILLGLGIFTLSVLLHAQLDSVQTGLVAEPVSQAPVSDQPDSVVQVTAEAQGLAPVAFGDLPRGGTFWIAQGDGVIPPYPCLPADYTNCPVYSMDDSGSFLVDGTFGQVPTVSPHLNRLSARSRAMLSTASTASTAEAVSALGNAVLDLIEQVQSVQLAQAMAVVFDLPMPGDEGGGSAPMANGLSSSVTDYGTNLWIAQVRATNGWLAGIATNTEADVQYEIQSRTNLAQPDWQSEGFIYGDELTNWTPLAVQQNGRTNLLIRLRSWASSDGSGLPDWWELQYFGQLGVDLYGNPAGDGYSNLYKFQNGMNPTNFYTPAAPQGVTASLHQSSQTATVSWQANGGNVTGYTIEKTDTFNFSLSVVDYTNPVAGGTSYVDSIAANQSDPFYGNTYDVSYRVRANYANGASSAWSASIPLQQITVTGSVQPGANGQTWLALSGIPANASSVRLTYIDDDTTSTAFNYSHDIPVIQITNGMYLLPASWHPPMTDARYSIYAASVDSAGNASAGYWFDGVGLGDDSGDPYNWSKPFYDGRTQMKQNLAFLLRAATKTQPFTFEDQATGYNYGLDSLFGMVYNPTNYAFSGFYGYNKEYGDFGTVIPTLPFDSNWLYRNFVYDPALLDGYGKLNTGIVNAGDDGMDLRLQAPAAYVFAPPAGNWQTSAPVLAAGQTRWLAGVLLDAGGVHWDELGIRLPQSNESYTAIAPNSQNLFGLPFLTAMATYHQAAPVEINQQQAVIAPANYVYYETAQPQFNLVEYDFWSHGEDYWDGGGYSQPQTLPGQDGFDPGQSGQPIILTSSGNSTQIAGYAKLAVQNGYSGVYGYLGQYFDKAYKVDANGTVTTNTTGILSPYGSFFATEPGQVALVTMPDPDTGARGTCMVYSASLQVDKNHDGVMDLAWNGADATSQSSPMVGWVNNGQSVAGTGGNLDRDFPVPPNHPEYANCVGGKITCQRDLENFFRLWICGVPRLPASQGYAVTISMTALSNNPAINLYMSSDPYGGTGYLTDTNVAAEQSRITLSPNPTYGVSLATINAQQSYTLPSNFFDYNYPYCSRFLFEGAGIGLGQLTLTISQNDNTIVQTSVWLDLHDIKDLYEQTHTTNIDTAPPSTKTSLLVEEKLLPANPAEDQQVVVYVHGLNNSEFDYYDSSETMFKRLYWQGYHGRFAAFRWPSPLFKAIPTSSDEISYLGFNTGEYISWHSGAALKAYIDDLHSRLTNYTVNLAAHSLGNVAANEAIREGAQVDNYALMQAAISAEAFDGNNSALNYSYLTDSSLPNSPDANALGGYNNCATNATRRVNFYNDDDWALFSGPLKMWEGNQHDFKPDRFTYPFNSRYAFSFDGTNCYFDTYLNGSSVSHRQVTEDFEKKAFVARSRTKAVGAAGLKYPPYALPSSLISTNISLQDPAFGFSGGNKFGDTRPDHSGEFQRPIQTTIPFFRALLDIGFDLRPKL